MTIRHSHFQLSGPEFKGFFIRSFKIEDNEDIPSGNFVPNPIAQIVSCSAGNSSVTHTNPDPKTEVKLDFVPECQDCQLYFNYTVVQEYSTFWTKVKSNTTTVQ